MKKVYNRKWYIREEKRLREYKENNSKIQGKTEYESKKAWKVG